MGSFFPFLFILEKVCAEVDGDLAFIPLIEEVQIILHNNLIEKSMSYSSLLMLRFRIRFGIHSRHHIITMLCLPSP
jgi:hypothetical protein